MIRTLRKSIETKGIGLHKGEEIDIRILPSTVRGIIFKRVDLKGQPQIKADAKYVVSSDNQTVLSKDTINISTVEHLMATFYALRINAAIIELNGDEIPAGDGSAKLWVDLIKKAGIKKIDSPNLQTKVKSLHQPIIVKDKEKLLIALPDNQFKITYLLSHPQIGQQIAHFTITPKIFCKEVALARTFSTYEEAKSLLAKGKALGGSLNNAVIVKDGEILTNLRYPNEFARHKVLDLIGDLALTDITLLAHIIGIKSGHRLNILLLREIMKQIGRKTKKLHNIT